VITLLLYTGLLLAAVDEPTAKPELADTVSRLVRQFDAARLTERDEAERKLLEMGPGVLPLLPPIGERTSAEVASRVAGVQHKLLRAQALAVAQPSLVTLKETDLPLAEVLQKIAKQTGNPISDHRQEFGEQRDEPRIKADFDKTPFWRALDNVLDQADLTLYGFAGQRGAFVVNRPPDAAPRAARACYSGLFRLEPLRFEAVRDLRNEKMAALKFFMEVTWEPRLQPFSIMQPLGDVSAVGDSGETISVASAEAEPEALIREGISAAELEIPLTLPKRSTEKIAVLKGKLLALVPGPAENFRFRDLPIAAKNMPSKPVEQRKAGTIVTIDRVRQNNDAWELSLRVKFEAPSTALESHRGWILENEAFFEDADHQRIEPGGIEQTAQDKDEVGMNYYFDLKQGPQKLTFVYRTPLMILELPVEYEFRDLRLP
jgi:hypothetical protein